jgi:tripartite-type tricarboxylate transporter receptor subunit TctC
MATIRLRLYVQRHPRLLASVLLVAASALAMSGIAQAQAYPSKPVRVVVPFSPGGTSDFIARILGKKLGEELGQSFIIDNRAGAGGTLGADIVAKAPGDGYTLLLYHIAIATGPWLYKNLPYDPRRDIAPITQIGSTPSILVVHPSLNVNSVKDLIALAKAQPGRITYGSAGIGSAGHLGPALFEYRAGVKLSHIPYKGGGPALVAASSGEVQMMIQTMPDTIRQVRAGRLKLLAVSTAKRVSDLPDVPTIAESGVPGYDYFTWFGLFAPGTTPQPLVSRLNQVTNKILAQPDLQTEFRKDGLDPGGSSVEDFRKFVSAEIDKWGKVIKAAGIEPN